jgi:hypothetical protein
MKGSAIPYSADELAWIEARKDWVISDLHPAFAAAFGRDDVSLANLHALRKRKGWRTGRTGHFSKGQEPPNKGKACPPGKGGRHPNAQRTQFKKGNRTGKANSNYQPIGTERISEDGYRERNVHDGMPMQSRWQLVHRIEWEAANGPVPDGFCLKCLGDRLNTDPGNWTLIPRALLPRLAGGRRKQYLAFDDAAPEVKPSILAVAQLEHRARTAKRKQRGEAA